jgi:hypothetical protein
MGLKGYRLWVMGQLDSTCRAPPRDGFQGVGLGQRVVHGGQEIGLSLTPRGCQIVYIDHTGCHQLNVIIRLQNNLSEKCQPIIIRVLD